METCQSCGGQLYQMDDINGCLKCGELSDVKKDEIQVMFKEDLIYFFFPKSRVGEHEI